VKVVDDYQIAKCVCGSDLVLQLSTKYMYESHK